MTQKVKLRQLSTAGASDDQFIALIDGQWQAVDLPVSGVAFDVTDTPPDPAPFVGYAWLSPTTGIAQIWSGTEWRAFDTTVGEGPPVDPGDPTDLPSRVGAYLSSVFDVGQDGIAQGTWTDSSSAANDLGAGFGTGPTYDVDVLNGHPALVFNGGGTQLNSPVPVERPCTVIAVMRNDDVSEGSILLSSTGGNPPYFGILNGVGVRCSDGSSTYLDHVLASNSDPHIVYVRLGAGGMMVGADGAKTSSAGVITPSFDRLGYYGTAGTYSMNGPVGAVYFFDAELTDGELDAIVHSLGLSWGIATSV